MINSKLLKILYVLTFTLIMLSSYTVVCLAETQGNNPQQYYYDDCFNTGKDTGYSKRKDIKKKDPHFGWQLGSFCVSGYTERKKDNKGNPVFLKTVGDEVILSFKLYENIDKLNGDSKLSISEDKNGYDEELGVDKQNFGRGALIVKQVNYQNQKQKPQVYTNYLAATAKKGAETKIQVCEEGDYTVALDYEIKDTPAKIMGKALVSNYTNYKILFEFSVRNGNNMVFLKDALTDNEIGNRAVVENGFYIDLANSHYLSVNVKRAVLNNGVEDIRMNEAAKDGESYTDEGIYTVTVSNPSTNQETKKKIYVGTNPEMKKYAEDGFKTTSTQDGNTNTPVEEQTHKSGSPILFIIIGIVITVIVLVLILFLLGSHGSKNTIHSEEIQSENTDEKEE